MNEVTRIHLGRQPFTISVDANHELKRYLSEIRKQVGDKDVAHEVEVRMSELLIERGITGDKVVIPDDIDYLKQQLGKPEDFDDESDAPQPPEDSETTGKRLFRDTDNALIAGVTAGLANYLGIDVVLLRIAFVLLTIFGGGSGIIIYLVLWLVVPPAVTTSEKLQMQGKPVTLEALKDSVSRADVAGTARRSGSKLLTAINGIFRVAIKLLGVAFILAGIGLIAFVGLVKMYMLLHGDKLFQENLFPVGVREHALLNIGLIMGIIVAIFLVIIGIASFRHKWPIRGWITGVLAGLLLLGSVIGGALAGDAVPHIRDRYQATLHTTAVKDIQPFNDVSSTGPVDLTYVSSPTYAVNLHYSGNPDTSKIKVEVRGGTLYIDSTGLENDNHCTMLCLFPRYDMTVQIYAPNVQDFKTPPHTDIFYPPVPAAPIQS
jgi:phage shock protein PspC (stress-responsive transcriptional regulator)